MNKHGIVRALKKILFSKGENYLFNNTSLRFLPGTRPIKRKYINAKSDVVRNDVLQIEYFEKHFSPTDVLWDIGSHNGHYSLFAASVVEGKNQVFSFEPDKDAMAIQKKNITLNKFEQKIKTYPIAVSNTDGHLQFHSMSGNSNSRIAKESDLQNADIISVPTKTLNILLKELPQPTFVKIDTEGAEIDILRSASDLLANNTIKFICELHPFAWDTFSVEYSEFETILKKYGRKISLLDTKKSISDLPYYGTIFF